MRVLWVDADENPWTEGDGWSVVEDLGLQLQRCASVGQAEPFLQAANFDLLFVRAELPNVHSFLLQARQMLGADPRRIVLGSSKWNKEDFKAHAKTEGAAHRYARVPMPPEGFLGLVADLFGCSVEEIAGFSLPEFQASEGAPVSLSFSAPAAAASRTARPSAASATKREAPARRPSSPATASGEDSDVLRKYLRIKEEQLEISEGERDELSQENERIQRETHQLQMRLRELEHLEEEMGKKLNATQAQRDEEEERRIRVQEEKDRTERALTERLRLLESQVSDASEKYENLRVRVRKDIRKIRENERDLEARLELLRKDSETLLKARDSQVLDLQRKIDALEFDLDQVQDSRVQAQAESERYLAKLARVSRALQIATGMIEDDPVSEDELDELEPLRGGAANAEEPKVEAAPRQALEVVGDPAENLPVPSEADGEEDAEAGADHDDLAQQGEPTQMIDSDSMNFGEGEPESSSG